MTSPDLQPPSSTASSAEPTAATPNDIPVLHQFKFSHFNEKARWGLDYKGVAHRRKSYLPGPHAPSIKRLTGTTNTPVLALDGELVSESARILETLERRYPEAPLFPEDPAARDQALEIQRHFDQVVGPAVRTALFSVLLDHPSYVCGMFALDKSWPTRALYRGTFPLARAMVARAYGVNEPARVERAFAITNEALDQIARQTTTGYLVGQRFTVADLACAALLAVLANPEHPDMRRPEPMPGPLEEFLARYRSHDAIAWVIDQYARHRPPSQAI